MRGLQVFGTYEGLRRGRESNRTPHTFFDFFRWAKRADEIIYPDFLTYLVCRQEPILTNPQNFI
ncbi:MAG: hypothetical protein JWR02_2456 [Mucilaginibacter sp.]|nr:hypothetical protein [Mucilaginibacter sp.]